MACASANQIKLPNGITTGSGQVVDVRMTANGSDTLVKDITFDANAPAGLYFSVILDNVPLDVGTQISRVRATYRMPQDGNTIVRALFDIPLSAFDGIADVYTFRLDGIQATGYLALQLTTTGNTTAAGMAGFAFDTTLVPEPSSLALLLFGGVAMACVTIRKRWRTSDSRPPGRPWGERREILVARGSGRCTARRCAARRAGAGGAAHVCGGGPPRR